MSVSDKPNTLRAQMKHHEPIICCAVKTKQIDMRTVGNTSHPLDSNDDKEPQAVCYAIEGNTVDRNSGKNGCGWCQDVSPTLNTQDRHAVCIALEGNGARPSHMGGGFSEDGKSYTLNTIERHSVCYSADFRNLHEHRDV